MATRHFTAEEVEDLVWETEVQRVITGSNRWSVDAESIVYADDGKYYKVYWNEAATEMQEHEFWSQGAIEVEQVTKEITVTDWFPVEDE